MKPNKNGISWWRTFFVLTDSNDPKQYIKRMRQRNEALAKGWVQFVPTLTVDSSYCYFPSQISTIFGTK